MSDQAELLQAYDSWREVIAQTDPDLSPAAFLKSREAELNAYRVALVREYVEGMDEDDYFVANQILAILKTERIEPPAFTPDIKAVAPWQ